MTGSIGRGVLAPYLYFDKQIPLIFIVKRRIPPQQDITNHPQRPHVDRFPVLFPLNDLRRDVPGRPAPLGESFPGSLDGKPEIGDFDIRVVGFGGQEEVFRFHVAVNDVP